MADREEEPGPSEAEQAFGALQAEVAATRQAVGALKKNQPGDTTVTLGEIVKALRAGGEYLQEIEQHPALQMTAEQYQRALAVAGGEMMRDVARKLDSAVTPTEKVRREFAGLI